MILPFEQIESRLLLSTAPNGPRYGSEWGLSAVAASSAWHTTTGSAAVVVADIDTGAEYTHQELYSNIWINQAEIRASYKSDLKDPDGDDVISFYDLNNIQNRPFMTDVNKNGYIDAGDLLNPISKGGYSTHNVATPPAARHSVVSRYGPPISSSHPRSPMHC